MSIITTVVLWTLLGPLVVVAMLGILANGVSKRFNFIEAVIWRLIPFVAGPLVWLLEAGDWYERNVKEKKRHR